MKVQLKICPEFRQHCRSLCNLPDFSFGQPTSSLYHFACTWALKIIQWADLFPKGNRVGQPGLWSLANFVPRPGSWPKDCSPVLPGLHMHIRILKTCDSVFQPGIIYHEGGREKEKERDLSLHAGSEEKVVIQTQGVGGECAEAAERQTGEL